jgi:hypothetical protein
MKQLTKEQIKKLPKIFGRDKKDNSDQEVAYIGDDREEAQEYVVDYLKSQGIKRPIVRESGIFEFGSVGMHTDYTGWGDKFSIVIMLKGKGEINFIDKGKIRGKNIKKNDVVVFQHSKPHSFINQGRNKCLAILSNISDTQAKKLLTQTKS